MVTRDNPIRVIETSKVDIRIYNRSEIGELTKYAYSMIRFELHLSISILSNDHLLIFAQRVASLSRASTARSPLYIAFTSFSVNGTL